MQACIWLSLLCLILVIGVTGLVPKLVVTTMTGTDFGSLATKETVLTGSQSRSEQHSGSYQECDLAGIARDTTITSASTTTTHSPTGSFLKAWMSCMGRPHVGTPCRIIACRGCQTWALPSFEQCSADSVGCAIANRVNWGGA